MNSFILPLTIESRKIIFLDLEANTKEYSAVPQTGEDIYIIEIPPYGKKELFSIPINKTLQSLEETLADIPFANLSFSHTYLNNIVDISIRNDENHIPNEPETKLYEGFYFGLNKIGRDISAYVRTDAYFTVADQDHLYIRFNYQTNERDYSYAATIKCFLAEKSKIKFAGLDFGSEASQMRDGKYNPVNMESITINSVDLFQSIKKLLGETDEDKNYHQFEENSGFYKSVFYADKKLVCTNDMILANENKIHDVSNSLHVLTKTSDYNKADFTASKRLIPNLKIIHGNPDYANRIQFTLSENGNSIPQNLAELKDSIYSGLLRKLITSYIHSYINNPLYLHFTLLVPNIYTIQEIILVKKIVRNIINESDKSGKILGLEISNLSESDASFLGCLKHEAVQPGNYYIIIDCGKGTTDFSIIQVDAGDGTVVKPIYRNGFAGAGNLISYAFFQSSLYFLRGLASNSENYHRNLESFLQTHFDSDSVTDFRIRFYQKIEEWKRNYLPGLAESETEKLWLQATSGASNITEWFSQPTTPSASEIATLIGKIPCAHDWNGYIERTVSDIATRVCGSLEQIVSHLERNKSKCGGILLTGRGFKFTPLRQALLAGIRSMKGLGDIKELNKKHIDLKRICMDGVFQHTSIIYADIASTPFESKKGESQQIRKKDITPANLLKPVLSVITQLINRVMGKEDAEYYREDSNELKVINIIDIQNSQFISSGKIYQPGRVITKNVSGAKLLLSRKGIYLSISYPDNIKRIYPLKEIGANNQDVNMDRKYIIKSLFPGLVDKTLFSE